MVVAVVVAVQEVQEEVEDRRAAGIHLPTQGTVQTHSGVLLHLPRLARDRGPSKGSSFVQRSTGTKQQR